MDWSLIIIYERGWILIACLQVERERAMKQSEVARREANDVRYRCFHSLWGNNVWQSPWCMYDHKHSEYAVWPDDVVANRVRWERDILLFQYAPISIFLFRQEKGAGHRSSPLYLYNHMFYTEGINELPTHLRFIINRAAGHFETADYNKNHCTKTEAVLLFAFFLHSSSLRPSVRWAAAQLRHHQSLEGHSPSTQFCKCRFLPGTLARYFISILTLIDFIQ